MTHRIGIEPLSSAPFSKILVPWTMVQVTVFSDLSSLTYFSILLSQLCITSMLCHLPYWWPTPSVVQPPIASIISAGHSTARNLSLRECLKEWITHPIGTPGFSHLLSAALAEFELHLAWRQYLGKAKSVFCSFMRFAAHNDIPTKGILRWLEEVFRVRHACSHRLMWGVSVSNRRSSDNRPAASASLIPVSDIRAINHLELN